MMYYWVHDVKAKHVMLFEDIANWDTMHRQLRGFGCRQSANCVTTKVEQAVHYFQVILGRFSVAFQSQDTPIWAVFEIAE